VCVCVKETQNLIVVTFPFRSGLLQGSRSTHRRSTELRILRHALGKEAQVSSPVVLRQAPETARPRIILWFNRRACEFGNEYCIEGECQSTGSAVHGVPVLWSQLNQTTVSRVEWSCVAWKVVDWKLAKCFF
jgi:hypothetical protein